MSAWPLLRFGLLRLTDAAPLIVAKELGYFAEAGVEAALSVEPSWANVADKLAYGLLDGAVLLPPLALAIGLGLRGAHPEPLVVPSGVSLAGNTVTLAEAWAEQALGRTAELDRPMETARRFAERVRRRGGRKPVLAVVHTFSTHNLLLRYWLAAAGLDPERDVELVVVPPAETEAALRAGTIDGFCAGAPWGEVAARAGLGRAVATSHGIWSNGPEKVFAVRQAIAEADPECLDAVLVALLRAARFCDAPENAPRVAAMLSREAYLALDPDIIRTSLPGADRGPPPGAPRNADVSVFFVNAATFPWRSHALWFVRQMARWGYVDRGAEPAATSIYRPDLWARAARSLGLPVPTVAAKAEGAHDRAWRLPADPSPIEMGPDLFMDDVRFEPPPG